jgi:16S rRNA (cytosine1402-N4)-methyltransferase
VKSLLKYGMFGVSLNATSSVIFPVPFKTIGKLIIPNDAEIKINNRARSAKLRIAEKT